MTVICGIFGIISTKNSFDINKLNILAKNALQRGKDASGLIISNESSLEIIKSNLQITNLLKKAKIFNPNFVFGHSRLVTNGIDDNQPIEKNGIFVLHNGIITNSDSLWRGNRKRNLEIDTEIIPTILSESLCKKMSFLKSGLEVLKECKGIVSAVALNIKTSSILLMSNNGSLYIGKSDNYIAFSSEKWPLELISFNNIDQILGVKEIKVKIKNKNLKYHNINEKNSKNLIPNFHPRLGEEKLLEYRNHNIQRCKRCILTKTMPYIKFDKNGICNYCLNYQKKNVSKPFNLLEELVLPYRKNKEADCIVPFSGGRDSCMSLHLIVKKLKMKPITYTYDWGMVNDLGRRNISKFCSELGVENIIIAADIRKKRNNIKNNLLAWLKKPHLGMISLLTAGDKHFFQHINTIKKQTKINLNIWGINPLETTHFKSGFLGIPPSFLEDKVYTSNWSNQMIYQSLRLKQFLNNLAYFNSSLWDTLTGEYWRTFSKKKDYFHIFDYYTWNEKEINLMLDNYGWERAIDTSSTWRLGDGTAPFYNYIYYTVAGFTEHDTFRSNQVREGELTRSEALSLVREENRPRYENFKWYLDTLNISFTDTVKIINQIPKLY